MLPSVELLSESERFCFFIRIELLNSIRSCIFFFMTYGCAFGCASGCSIGTAAAGSTESMSGCINPSNLGVGQVLSFDSLLRECAKAESLEAWRSEDDESLTCDCPRSFLIF